MNASCDWRLFAVTVLAGSGLLRAQTAAPSSQTATIVGIVAMKESSAPLGYSVVSIPALGRERFTNDQGEFVFADVPAGSIELRVRHLGYTPVNVSVLVRAGRSDTVRVELVHIAVRLTTVQVHGYPECKNPGAPTARDDSSFATMFEQLQQNADQYRLLTKTYPFNFAFERMLATANADGDLQMERIDTVALRSVDQWVYKPGTVLTTDGPRIIQSPYMLNLPTLSAFADNTFLANHCFHNGGLETVDGRELVRIDFVAASRLRDPDVDGAMYLDPSNFQIRRAFLHLSKIPRSVRGLAEVEVTTLFGEIFPSVPVISAVSSVNQFSAASIRPNSPVRAIEEQRLIAVKFMNGRPGDEGKKPEK